MIRRLKKLTRSWSDPSQRKTPAPHKTLQRVKSAIPASRSDRGNILSRKSSREEQDKSSEHKFVQENTPLIETSPSAAYNKYIDLLPEETSAPICEQPRLSYFSYLGRPNRLEVLALRQAMRPSEEEEEWEQFTTARLLNTEAQEERATTVGYSKSINMDKWVDCCTCMCCVKALFYHCTKDGDYQSDPASDPCSCQRPGTECLGRWSILCALSVSMPCMLCYPLIQALLTAYRGSETVEKPVQPVKYFTNQATLSFKRIS